jgi:hypothetical protein
VTVLSLSFAYATFVKELPNCTFWLGCIWYKVWVFIGRRFRIEEQFLPPFCRFTLEWIVWWHLVWLFKTNFVSIGVHCWSWLSLPTGCSQTRYLSYVVYICHTLNYISDKCPEFMAKSLCLQTDSFSPSLNILWCIFSIFEKYLGFFSVWHYGTDCLWRWMPADYQQTWALNAICPHGVQTPPPPPPHTHTHSVDLTESRGLFHIHRVHAMYTSDLHK